MVLTQAVNSHDVGHARGGRAAALRRVTAPALVAGVDTDRLYPLSQQAEPVAASVGELVLSSGSRRARGPA